MTSSGKTVETRVVEIIADTAGLPAGDVSLDAELSSLGMGSLEKLECVLSVEDAFRVELAEPDLRRLRTVREVVAAVERAVAAAS